MSKYVWRGTFANALLLGRLPSLKAISVISWLFVRLRILRVEVTRLGVSKLGYDEPGAISGPTVCGLTRLPLQRRA